MKLSEYLAGFKSKTLYVVGPLFGGPYDAFAAPVVFVDGGAAFKGKRGFSVGDGDSFSGLLDEKLSTRKDFSDLAYVLRNIPARYTHIELHGFRGGRLDHELFNLGELAHFLNSRKSKCTACVDKALMAFSAGKWDVTLTGEFSLFSLSSAKFKITGRCEYQLKKAKQIRALSSHLLSNVAFGKVKVECTCSFFIYQ